MSFTVRCNECGEYFKPDSVSNYKAKVCPECETNEKEEQTMVIQNIMCKWNFADIPCEECGEDSSPTMKGGGLADWKDPEMGRSILCGECIELHELDLYAIILDWRTEP